MPKQKRKPSRGLKKDKATTIAPMGATASTKPILKPILAIKKAMTIPAKDMPTTPKGDLSKLFIQTKKGC